MPSRVSIIRRRRAFDEGRRSVADAGATCPYDNATLKALWEDGRKKQASGELTTAVPALDPGERRAARPTPGAPKLPRTRPTGPPRNRPPGQGRPPGGYGPTRRYR